jgi:hypothetical protein
MRREACALADLAVSVFGPRLAQGERPSSRAAIAWEIVVGAIQAASPLGPREQTAQGWSGFASAQRERRLRLS